MTCIELVGIGQNLSTTLKARISPSWLSNKIQDTPTKTGMKSSLVSERSAYSLQNYVFFSPLTSGLESFGHKSTRSHKILASMKMGGA